LHYCAQNLIVYSVDDQGLQQRQVFVHEAIFFHDTSVVSLVDFESFEKSAFANRRSIALKMINKKKRTKFTRNVSSHDLSKNTRLTPRKAV